MPEQDAVIAITSGVRDMQAVLNLVWEHLLPGDEGETALPADDRDADRLTQKLASLSLAAASRDGRRPPSPRRSRAKVYELPKNDDGLEAVGLEVGHGARRSSCAPAARSAACPSAYGEWRRGGSLPATATGGERSSTPVAASGAWTSDDTYTVKACFYETPFCATLALRFAGDALVLDQEMNVGFGPTKRPQLVGLRAGRSAPPGGWPPGQRTERDPIQA